MSDDGRSLTRVASISDLDVEIDHDHRRLLIAFASRSRGDGGLEYPMDFSIESFFTRLLTRDETTLEVLPGNPRGSRWSTTSTSSLLWISRTLANGGAAEERI